MTEGPLDEGLEEQPGNAVVGEGFAEAGPEPPITAHGAPIISDEDWVYDLGASGLAIQQVNSKVLGLTHHGANFLTRRFIKPTITPGGPEGETVVEVDIHHQVEIDLYHQRRRNAGVPYSALDLRYLKGGWWTHVPLNSAETLQLYKHLDNLYAIGATGVSRTRRSLRVVEADEVTVAGELGDIIARLRAEHGDAELSRHLGDLAPDLIATMALKVEHTRRVEALEVFEAHIRPATPDLVWTEPQWKDYFKRNEWIFGHNLDFQFLNDEMPEAYVGGRRPSGGGSQIADHIMGTGGDWSFAVLVEIKRPNTRLLGAHIREGTCRIHGDLSEGVAQAQSNCQALIAVSTTGAGALEFNEREMTVADPRGIVVIGDTNQFENAAQRQTFQRYRHNLWNPTIMTYDELLNRAKFQVARTTPPGIATSAATPAARAPLARSDSAPEAPTRPFSEEPFRIVVGSQGSRAADPEWGPAAIHEPDEEEVREPDEDEDEDREDEPDGPVRPSSSPAPRTAAETDPDDLPF
ncbi:MAG: DUF4263 domain-containing protein [Chloroflexi bacterium]|nr:DUF4263 domain-containing protein [Chloroflexota bacterium]